MKPGRIPCVIPFCRRTADATKYGEDTVIICGKHWRMASATLRRRRSKLERRYRRRFGDQNAWDMPAGTEREEAIRLQTLIHDLWERCKSQAIEAAAGIG
ncbi:hypothetical protein [Bradyrhizobium sp. SZCCHNR3015]|uniref:hypothetical protein n=1 Tax=Bradyrhizobium sp. SZCCHNR3015 TaxID=3057395 RepID=UPI0029164F43|nr:hypothetical protein [Bradyrhizobium sp. SZCCHNR3015]